MSTSSRSKRVLVAGLALALTLGSGSLRARVTGEIQGRVSDESGIALPGVAVKVDNQETGASRSTVTNASGFYAVPAVAGGRYALRASRGGFRTAVIAEIRLGSGQTLDLDLELARGETGAAKAVPGGPPLLETARSSAVVRVDDKTVAALPIADRDFGELALLAAGVLRDSERGFLTLGGQRGIYSGLEIDGADARSAFFGYGRGGEATANDGLVVAAETVAEIQVVVAAVAPEAAPPGGAYVSLVTRGGANALAGRAFFHSRDEDLKERLEPSPLDRFRGHAEPFEPGEFSRQHYGASIGGPLKKDRSHFFLAFDRSDRSEPFERAIDARGLYDAILARAATDPRFLALVTGFTPRADGVAAPDPFGGRTAAGRFSREVDNRILFGRIDHRFNDANTSSGRVNLGDYERRSSFADEESAKLEDTLSMVLHHVSVVGSNKVNELTIQFAADDLDRLSARIGQGIAAQIDYLASGADAGNLPASLGKPGSLPVVVEEERLEVRDGFSFLAGGHGVELGLDYRRDDLRNLFAGGRDGVYHFESLADFLANDAAVAEVFFGDVTFPNFDATRELWGLYGQDSFRARADLSLDYGLRLAGTRNPEGREHLFAAGRDIPDDTDNVAPRLGFAWTPDGAGRSVVRGGVGLFFAPPPALVFTRQARENGLFPNAGRVAVAPGDVGYVPLGETIDNRNPPPGAAVATGFVDPGYEDAEILRVHLGYERQFARDWSCGVDLMWADGDNLLENVDVNRSFTTDEAGRPIYSPDRPLTRGDVTGEADDTPLAEVLTHQSIGESEYRAITLSVRKRFSDRYQLRAHYTWAEDRDTSSNERSAAAVTLLRPDDPRYDFGFSDRDVRNRLVVSGLAELPYDFTVGGVYEHRGGRPFNPVDRGADFAFCGFTSLGFNCPDIRPIGADGNVLARNSFRNGSFERLDLRIGKFFEFGGRYRVDVFFEVFNVFDEQQFEVDDSGNGDRLRDPTSDEFGLASQRILDSREVQIGLRFSF